MARGFTVNGVVFAHADATMTITPHEGINAGVHLELAAVKSFTGDLGASSTQIDGTQVAPLALAPTAAKPTWEAELSALGQALAVTEHLGPGAVTIPCAIKWTFQRPGQRSYTISIPTTLITKGLGGFKSDAGAAPTGSIGGNATNILHNGIDLLNRPRVN